MAEINGYDLSRNWFDWSFSNPEKIKPNHSALYFFCIEHCNRLGWKEKFGLPTTMAMEAIGIRSYNTYINTLNDLVEFSFIKLIEKSKNQYSSNIIALSNFNKAHNKALDKALIKHTSKHSESTGESISSIDKQITINKETIEQDKEIFETLKFELFNSGSWISDNERLLNTKNIKMYLTEFLDELFLKEDYFKDLKDVKSHFVSWVKLKIEKSKQTGFKQPEKITVTTKPKPFPHETRKIN